MHLASAATAQGRVTYTSSIDEIVGLLDAPEKSGGIS
jgi:hypothetical protein